MNLIIRTVADCNIIELLENLIVSSTNVFQASGINYFSKTNTSHDFQ